MKRFLSAAALLALTLALAGTTLTENLLGILAEGAGGIFSRGNNTVEGNSFGHDFTALFAAK